MRKYVTIAIALTFMLFALGLLAQTTGSTQANPASGTNSSQNPNSPAGDQNQTSNASSSSQSSTTTSQAGSADSQSDTMGSQSGNMGSQSGGMGSQPGSMGSQPGSMGSQSSTYPSTQSNPQSSTSTSSSSSNMGSQAKAKTIEGCIVNEQSDYFLVPKKGNPVLLNSGAAGDLSAHVGHRVKIKGNETSAATTGASSSTMGGTSASASADTGTAGSNTSSSGSVSENPNKTSNPVPGEPTTESNSTQSPTGSTKMGSSSGGNLHAAANEQIVVDKLTMVSESCPANWNSKFSGGSKSSPANPSNY